MRTWAVLAVAVAAALAGCGGDEEPTNGTAETTVTEDAATSGLNSESFSNLNDLATAITATGVVDCSGFTLTPEDEAYIGSAQQGECGDADETELTLYATTNSRDASVEWFSESNDTGYYMFVGTNWIARGEESVTRLAESFDGGVVTPEFEID